MEIAKLEVLLAGDVKQLEVALDKGKVLLGNFATTGANGLNILNAGLSKTALAALTAATDLKGMLAALDLLQAEQAGIIRGSTLWRQYETAIKQVNRQLDILEAELPVVATEMKVVGASSTTSLSGIGKGLTGALGGLRSIAYILPGIGIAGLFNLAFEAISSAAEALDIFNSSAKELADATDKAVESFSDEANKVDILVGKLKDENTTREDKKRIIKELQDIAPNYFNNLKLEGDKVKNLTDDYANYGRAIILVAKIKGASDLNQQNVTAGIQLQLKTSRDLQELYKDRAKFDDLHLAFVTREGFILERQLEGQTEIAQKSKAYLDIIIAAQKELDALGGAPGKPPPTKDLKEVADHLEKIKAIKFIEPFIPWAPIINDVNKELTKTGSLMANLPKVDFFKIANLLAAEKLMKRWNEQLKIATEVSKELAHTFTRMFTDILKDGKISFQRLAQELISLIARLAEAALQAAILKVILSALGGGPIPNPGALSNFIGSGIHLAEGGVTTGPTTALIGEAGPEAIIPLDRLQQMIGGMGNNIHISGELRAHGTDLVVALNRGNVRINRNYGSNFTN